MDTEIQQIEKEIFALKQKRTEARRRRPHEEVRNYTFLGPGGASISLEDLFGQKQDLLVVHNMGKRCSYCTLWADGFQGLLPHLEDRAAFVLVSPDDPQTQVEFAASRGWEFRVVSDQERAFTQDMGYVQDGDVWPGVSAFRKGEDGKIYRTGTTFLGPGDDYCSVWPLFDMLAKGPDGWEPKYIY